MGFKKLVSTLAVMNMLAQTPLALATQTEQKPQVKPQDKINSIQLESEDLKFFAYMDELYKEEAYTRPASCPLEPKGHEDLLKKIKAIELLLNNECLGTEAGTVERILNGVDDIKGELAKASNSSSGSSTSIDGGQVSNYLGALNTINNLYIKMKCEGQRMSFLNKTAEFISGIAQLGLLSTNPNGIIIAAAGSAISAILNIIDDMFTKQYEFKYEDERMAFVKINCAFRDLRRDLQKSGLLQTGDEVHQRYAEKINTLLGSIQGKMDNLSALQKEITQPIRANEKNEIGSTVEQYASFDKSLEELGKILSAELPQTDLAMRIQLKKLYEFNAAYSKANEESFIASYAKLFSNNDLVVNNKLIVPEAYAEGLSNVLSNSPESLTANIAIYEPKEFIKERVKLASYLPLIQEDVRLAKNRVVATYQEKTKAQDGKLSANDQIRQSEALIAKKKEGLESKVGRLLSIKGKLDNILKDEKIVSTDNGSLTIVTIMEKYVSVESKFYGDLGKQFMDYVVDEGVKTSKDFNRKIKRFEASHDIEVEKSMTIDDNGAEALDYKFIDSSKYSFEQKKRACQDLRPYLVRFSLSNSLMNAGYDYIWTNRDLFHSDYPKVIFRLFGLFSEPQRYLQYHEKSATRANILINGGSIEREDFEKYIQGDGLSFNKKKNSKERVAARVGSQAPDRFPAKGSKSRKRAEETDAEFAEGLGLKVQNLMHSDKRTQGMLMLLVDKNRKKAETLSLIDAAFNCEKVLSADNVSLDEATGASEGKERISIK